jgi:hypothetical protein
MYSGCKQAHSCTSLQQVDSCGMQSCLLCSELRQSHEPCQRLLVRASTTSSCATVSLVICPVSISTALSPPPSRAGCTVSCVWPLTEAPLAVHGAGQRGSASLVPLREWQANGGANLHKRTKRKHKTHSCSVAVAEASLRRQRSCQLLLQGYLRALQLHPGSTAAAQWVAQQVADQLPLCS